MCTQDRPTGVESGLARLSMAKAVKATTTLQLVIDDNANIRHAKITLYQQLLTLRCCTLLAIRAEHVTTHASKTIQLLQALHPGQSTGTIEIFVRGTTIAERTAGLHVTQNDTLGWYQHYCCRHFGAPRRCNLNGNTMTAVNAAERCVQSDITDFRDSFDGPADRNTKVGLIRVQL